MTFSACAPRNARLRNICCGCGQHFNVPSDHDALTICYRLLAAYSIGFSSGLHGIARKRPVVRTAQSGAQIAHAMGALQHNKRQH